ncbi:MAG: ATP-binding protein [Candidatus Thiodiazotropha lotti]|nr:ATP-binding protein [Candidatus Thiodiazotropha lotti]MCG7999033.1 ATP-binding protein [Candidatus Thiodiazotropha lotti]MCW4181984.1 ATP-binding protein [Candidatus Thiodiazotropha weberae]MCW4190801.1 ATP-binding protein [Candidatus Thiodiazotropha weberae]
MCLYIFYVYLFIPSESASRLLPLALLYTLCSLMIMMVIAWKPHVFTIRRTITMSFDVSMITLAMWIGGETTSMLYVFYLWISLGNGFRFGTPSLYFTSTLSTLGFASVILISDFWKEQQVLGIGLLLGLLITTLYVALLLLRIEREKKRAEASSQAKSRFLANMSHEIRTPLNGVVGMTDLLARTPMGLEQREIMSTIQASAETLLNLIEEILDFSKIEAGKVEVRLVDQDLSELADSVISMMKPTADSKGIELNCWIDLDISPVIKTDPKLLRQILINLLNNAIKFTDQGGIVLKVTPYTSAESEDGVPRLMFEVIDTGIGISEAQQKRIFEWFEQGDDSATRRYTGSGLGTTITKQLVELLDGTIGLESRLGEGSRFWFQIPAVSSDTPIDIERFQDARVLLFTDLLSEKQDLLDGLQEWQLDVKVYSNLSEGFLELINAVKVKEPYDIAILDETHSDLHDEELVHTIRAEKSLDNLGLVCVINYSPNLQNENRLCHEGFSAVVTTPITPDKVRHVLQYALKRKISTNLPPRIFTSAEHSIAKHAQILLAEDNPINQKVVKKILELQGHQIEVVSHGQEAIELLKSETFDLAILDLQMPDIGGIDIIKAYRLMQKQGAAIPFVILTANATREAAEECEAIGVEAYLTKPVRSAHLLDVVKGILGGDSTEVITDTIVDLPIRAANQEKSGRILDVNTLQGLERLSKDPEFMSHLADSFLHDSEALMTAMHQAIELHDVRGYKDCAHALADNASGIGAYSLMTICASASRIEQPELNDQGVKQMSQISTTYSLTCQALRHYLNIKNPE